MRGKLAKQLRKLATGVNTEGEQVLDKAVYKLLKRTRRTGQEPKLENNPRWLKSPLHRAKVLGSGIHFVKYHPLREIGDFYSELNEQGRKLALSIAKNACRLTKFELRSKIEKLKLHGQKVV